MDPLGLYVHVPFCSAICHYCNFNRGLYDADAKSRYVEALMREITARGEGAAADSIFFGGGTPSLLDPDEVACILEACQSAFVVAADAEITLEANPETASNERLREFRAAGVNRLSLGVQSFRDEELQRLGRVHSAAGARDAYWNARAAGFENVSLDLMMWLPEQSVDDWLLSIDDLIELAPDHASLYLLEIYPNAPLRDLMSRGAWSVAPDDEAAEMYLRGLARLDEAGFVQYEISNVAKPRRRSRHNLKYWTDQEWIGFGCGAHSTRYGVRERNLSSVQEYVAAIASGGPVRIERRVLTDQERLEEALFTGLRLAEGLCLEDVRSRYGADLWRQYGSELQPFVDSGLLIYDDHTMRLTRAGMLLAHEIMVVFIGSPVR